MGIKKLIFRRTFFVTQEQRWLCCKTPSRLLLILCYLNQPFSYLTIILLFPWPFPLLQWRLNESSWEWGWTFENVLKLGKLCTQLTLYELLLRSETFITLNSFTHHLNKPQQMLQLWQKDVHYRFHVQTYPLWTTAIHWCCSL